MSQIDLSKHTFLITIIGEAQAYIFATKNMLNLDFKFHHKGQSYIVTIYNT